MSKIQTGIGPMTDTLFNNILDKLNNDDFRIVMDERIVVPITNIVNQKVRPYIYISLFMYALVVVLLIIIICMLRKQR